MSHTFALAGQYFIRACADKTDRNSTGSIAESDEDDNCGEWTPILVADTVMAFPGEC